MFCVVCVVQVEENVKKAESHTTRAQVARARQTVTDRSTLRARFGFLQDGDVAVCMSPEGEEILAGGEHPIQERQLPQGR